MSGVRGPHMTGTVIEMKEGYRFISDSDDTKLPRRLTYLSPAGMNTPEAEEVPLAQYAGKRIRFTYDRGMLGAWVYGVNDIQVI
jgi:hypothetical protein